jgi:hypothetical protein
MKSKKGTGNARTSGKRAQKDLTARKASGVKGGDSDLAAKLREQLAGANSIYRAVAAPPPPGPQLRPR